MPSQPKWAVFAGTSAVASAAVISASIVFGGCGSARSSSTSQSGSPAHSGAGVASGASSVPSGGGAQDDADIGPLSAFDAAPSDGGVGDATVSDGPGDDATDGATGDSPADSTAPCPTMITGAQTTSGLPGWVGDYSPGDYPSGDAAAENYLSISNVQGQQGLVRQYKVHVPTGYTSGTAMPALFCIHGLGQTAAMFCMDEGVAWPTKADQEGFVVIMPNGYQNSWNGGSCCGQASSMGLDDVALMRAIFAEVGKHVNIDLRRVYSTGLSNGGFMSYRLACQASDMVTAIAVAAGAVGTAAIGSGTNSMPDLTTCAPTNKVSVLDVHGTMDPLVSFSTQAKSLAIVTSNDGCSSTAAPAAIPPSGGDTTCVTYTGCPTCPRIEVTGCAVDGGGHCWFGSTDCGTGGGAIGKAIVGNDSNFMKDTDQFWAFLSRLSR